MRYLYTALFYLAIPLVLIRLLWRSMRQPAYRQRLPERFGFYKKRLPRSIWIHAVSVGEVIAAIPLIQSLKQRYPDLTIVVTTMTPTGAERVQSNLGDKVVHLYLPYDLPDAIQRFLQAINPIIAVMMETELWPNLFAACREKKIPVCLMNARLSAASAQGYQRARSVVQTMLQGLHLIAANEVADAQRFIALGAAEEKIVVTGNIKFDLTLPRDLEVDSQQLRQYLGKRFIWIAASTHAGEEEKILAVHQALLEVDPQALLIVVPRHPNRFDTVAKMCAAKFITARRSHCHSISMETAVYVGDTMGELMLLYSVADVVFVGGSLVPHGGHNMLEPAVLRKPILTGPHLRNFIDISKLFEAEQALLKVEDESGLTLQLKTLRESITARTALGQRAYDVVIANRGALERQIRLLNEVIDSLTIEISSPAAVSLE